MHNPPMTSALLIIDVQHGMCAGEYVAHDAQRVIERINTLSAKARAAGVPVVFIQHDEDDGPLRLDSPGWQLAEGLKVDANDLRVRKRTSSSFHDTNLHALLRERGVTRVVACGLQSEYCVDSTVRSAVQHGYDVTLVSDAHSTFDNAVLTAAQISAHENATLNGFACGDKRVSLSTAGDLQFA
jgi:nicotinamidase-related amidase